MGQIISINSAITTPTVNEWVWLCFNKTLFTQTGGGLDFACRPQLADAWLRLITGLTKFLTRSRTSSTSLRKDDMGDGGRIPGKRLWSKSSCTKRLSGWFLAEMTVHCWSNYMLSENSVSVPILPPTAKCCSAKQTQNSSCSLFWRLPALYFPGTLVTP